MNVKILTPTVQNKRFRAVINNNRKTVNFGTKDGFTYFDGATLKKRNNYIKRHKALGTEDWADFEKAAAWSRWYLWELNNPTIYQQKKYFKDKFNINLEILYFKKNMEKT